MNNLTLSSDQNAAVDLLDDAPIGGLIGNAGTGKTTVAEAVVDRLSYPILTAPTHKAAHVLALKTGRPVQTIHSLLKLVPVPDGEGGRVLRQQGEPEIEPGSTIVIDEASMLDPYMLGLLDEQIEEGINVVLIGDASQLPPVGYDNAVFMDWLMGHDAPVAELTKIHRQASDSPLPHIAAGWRLGAGDPVWPAAASHGATGGADVLRRPVAMDMFLAGARAHHGSGAPSRDASPWLAYTNNAVAQAGEAARAAIYGAEAGAPYVIGEKVVVGSPYFSDGAMVLASSQVVDIVSEPMVGALTVCGEEWNGYQFTVETETSRRRSEIIAMPYAARKEMLAHFANTIKKTRFGQARADAWKEFYAMENMVLDLRTIYSSTIHKSQGSTYPEVFIDKNDLMNPYAASILRQLGYVALTRPSGYARIAS